MIIFNCAFINTLHLSACRGLILQTFKHLNHRFATSISGSFITLIHAFPTVCHLSYAAYSRAQGWVNPGCGASTAQGTSAHSTHPFTHYRQFGNASQPMMHVFICFNKKAFISISMIVFLFSINQNILGISFPKMPEKGQWEQTRPANNHL